MVVSRKLAGETKSAECKTKNVERVLRCEREKVTEQVQEGQNEKVWCDVKTAVRRGTNCVCSARKRAEDSRGEGLGLLSTLWL